MEAESIGAVQFVANVSGIRTDARTGGWKITLDVPESEALKMMGGGLGLYLKNVQAALVPLPEEV
jgi:hypothetical protein